MASSRSGKRKRKAPPRTPPNRSIRTAKKEARFLAALAEGASIAKAARIAGVGRRTAYEWREADEAFAKAWDAAIEAGTDLLEDEALRRGRDGVKKPVFYQGRRVAFVQEYSDTLLIFTLKARRPEKFRDNVDLNLKGKLTLEQLVMGSMPPSAPVEKKT